MSRIAVFLLALAALAGCTPSPDHEATASGSTNPAASHEIMLAYHDGVSRDDVTVDKYRRLLADLENTYSDPSQGIYETIVSSQVLLKKHGIPESEMHILEALDSPFVVKPPKLKIDEWAAAYMTLRETGQSHVEAARGVQALLQAVITR